MAKIYIAGPMRGIPRYNFPEFDRSEMMLRSRGWEPVSPARMDRDAGFNPFTLPEKFNWESIPEGFDFKACVDRCIEAVRECEAIYMLHGWEESIGAVGELSLARWMGKRVFYQDDGEIPQAGQPEPIPDAGVPEAVAPAAEVRVKDEKTGGEKGQKLARFDLIPWDAMWSVAELYGRGAAKYSERNWEKGYAWHLSHAALLRHLAQFWQERERMDEETGSHHMACVAFHALALLAFDLRGAGTDNRPIQTISRRQA